jgi:hypothetical protein
MIKAEAYQFWNIGYKMTKKRGISLVKVLEIGILCGQGFGSPVT